MGERSVAAVAVGGRRVEIDEFPLPDPDDSSGLLRVEACGVCGSDIKKYSATTMSPTILGHESVGRIERVGATAARRWGVEEGDRVLLEEYLPCGHCAECRSGEFRSCSQTDNHGPTEAIRYGSTPVQVPPALWGGYSQYQYLHPTSVIHKVPGGVSSPHAAFALPLSNGIQWTQLDARVGMGDVVVIQGPGQQGIGCLIASKAAGAAQVIVSGLSRDAARLRLATELGADRVVDVESEDLVEVVEDATGGRLADVTVDTSGAGASTLAHAVSVARKRGTVVLASGSASNAAAVDLNTIRRKQLVVRGVRGHSYRAVELALQIVGGGTLPLDRIGGRSFGLADTVDALRAIEGTDGFDGVHATVVPEREREGMDLDG